MAKKKVSKQEVIIEQLGCLVIPETNGEVIQKLSREEVKEAASFDREQALALVGMYYSIQKLRVGASNRISAHERQVDILADTSIVKTLKKDLQVIENQAKRGLTTFARSSLLGQWCMTNLGVGPVITAGLLAHIDLHRAQTAGAIYRFGGIEPTVKWERGQKRPYNANLKKLFYLLGESFKKVHKREDAFYGKIWAQRKAREIERNEAGLFRDDALARLAEALKAKRKIPKELKEIWADGKLPPGGLDKRAGRYAVKIFVSHLYTVGREILGLPLVKPWVIEHGGHVHYIPPPHWRDGKIVGQEASDCD